MRIRLFGKADEGNGAREPRDDDGPLAVSGDARIEGEAAFPTGLVATGNLELAPGAVLDGCVRVAGNLVMGEGARVVGDAKVDGDAVFARGACVLGALACRRLLFRTVARVDREDEAASVEPAAATV